MGRKEIQVSKVRRVFLGHREKKGSQAFMDSRETKVKES